ncbi:hypothetical protein IAR55_006471 [Kwoniella newhampshirensis]|uniref:Uncharacterized protein n=1 Tax=Kwoniella newhampshirensis TaxID=1651941 RepID=A0AAW0YE80_9TREE
MEGDSEAVLSTEDVLKSFGTIQTAVDATTSSSTPLVTKARNIDPSLDFSSGLSLLLLRPHLLLSSLHNLIILLALRLTNAPLLPDASTSSAFSTPFASSSRSRDAIDTAQIAADELAGELVLSQEVMEKVRGLESKLDYQIKKLVGLAEAEEKRGQEVPDDAEDDPLSFRPNPSAILTSRAEPKARREYATASDSEGESSNRNGVYRPPRVAAVPYTESSSSSLKTPRNARKAPALLSEFAATMDGAPLLESTSGLSVRPVTTSAAALKHTNSISQKRAAELARINEFEEENMTRLVTSKREQKRRREDEAALAMGYGIGHSRGRRGRNGLEAELEGVLGERGSKGVWDGVGKLGDRGGALERGKGRRRSGGDDARGGRPKKARFEKELARRRK